MSRMSSVGLCDWSNGLFPFLTDRLVVPFGCLGAAVWQGLNLPVQFFLESALFLELGLSRQ
jgi:hypothetical protein